MFHFSVCYQTLSLAIRDLIYFSAYKFLQKYLSIYFCATLRCVVFESNLIVNHSVLTFLYACSQTSQADYLQSLPSLDFANTIPDYKSSFVQ